MAADLSGVVLEDDSVFYACREKNATLNDGSGMGVYQAKCENGTLEPKTWPICEIMVIPTLFLFNEILMKLYLDSMLCVSYP